MTHNKDKQGGNLHTIASLSFNATKADGYFKIHSGSPFASIAQSPAATPVIKNFLAGCIAACGAVTLTNPFDVVRTRLELQGELAHKGITQQFPYKNPFQALKTILQHEGPLALGKGLLPAYGYQIAANGTRLGSYQHLKNWIHAQAPAHLDGFAVNLLAGAVAGMIGAALGSPFQLVKTRLQAAAANPALAVGTQHGYTGFWHAVGAILGAEGPLGLYRGMHVNMVKIAVGSAMQLAVYDTAKARLLEATDGRAINPVQLHIAASLLAGMAVTASINPIDVVTTRLWNQPVVGGRGTLYRGAVDCAWKTLVAEGPGGLYKGALAHFLRVGPHTVFTFLILEQVQRLMKG